MPIATTTQQPEHNRRRGLSETPITDVDIEVLKNVIRMNLGRSPVVLTSTPTRVQRQKASHKPPSISMRSTETSRLRERFTAFRMFRWKGILIEDLTPEEEEMLIKRKPNRKLKAKLRQLREWTPEQLEQAIEKAEIERIKNIRIDLKINQNVPFFRENTSSIYRYQCGRNETIISHTIRRNYDDYEKPPFDLKTRYSPPNPDSLPPIDREKEIWFIPVEGEAVTKSRCPLKRCIRVTRKPTTTMTTTMPPRPPLKKYKKPKRMWESLLPGTTTTTKPTRGSTHTAIELITTQPTQSVPG